MATRESLIELAAKCNRLGIDHTGIQDRAGNEAVVDVPDPDGTVLRFYWVGGSGEADHFMGIEFDAAGQVTFYDRPRLTVQVPT